MAKIYNNFKDNNIPKLKNIKNIKTEFKKQIKHYKILDNNKLFYKIKLNFKNENNKFKYKKDLFYVPTVA